MPFLPPCCHGEPGTLLWHYFLHTTKRMKAKQTCNVCNVMLYYVYCLSYADLCVEYTGRIQVNNRTEDSTICAGKLPNCEVILTTAACK